MVVGTTANAVVTVGDAVCTGAAPAINCTKSLTCETGSGRCAVSAPTSNAATCVPDRDRTSIITLIASQDDIDPSCAWTVTDTSDGSSIEVTIDGSDGLPVELQSMSVE